ncbi:MAG: hypothetical protein INR73_20050 [Williamsia sp.]|nr:hypothetical protein [Williamsia sp.]
MVLHPAGGSVEHLIRITRVIVITHAIAIISLPFGRIGFWGLTRRIGTDHFGSVIAMVIASFGLVAVMLAGAANGLIMPIFLQYYKDATPESIAAIKPVLQYSYAVNHAFDYIYTGAFSLAILCWSGSIVYTRKLAVWIGWVGIVLALAIVAVFVSGVAVNSLHGFRIFGTAVIAWILVVGVMLRNQK